MTESRISAIIPAWCEAKHIAATVSSCAAWADEVIVVDAASADGTAAVASDAGALVIQSERGRGPQLNAGASAASGDAFVFVHADTLFSGPAGPALRAALSNPCVVGGNFRLRFVPETPIASLYSTLNHGRRVLLRIYYGDSCIFARRSAFERLGGFAALPLFEDYEFVRRLEKLGPTHYICDPEVWVSSRRFEAKPLRTLALWTALQSAYSLGVPAERLARYYAAVR